MVVLFLDIDGVLNDHFPMNNGYCGIDKEKVKLLNLITDVTKVPIVITSAWRYLVHGKSMTRKGFKYLLASHGIKGKVIGLTRSDKSIDEPRYIQIADYLKAHPEIHGFVIVDDMPVQVPFDYKDTPSAMYNGYIVRTDGKIGLTKELTQEIIEYIRKCQHTK